MVPVAPRDASSKGPKQTGQHRGRGKKCLWQAGHSPPSNWGGEPSQDGKAKIPEATGGIPVRMSLLIASPLLSRHYKWFAVLDFTGESASLRLEQYL